MLLCKTNLRSILDPSGMIEMAYPPKTMVYIETRVTVHGLGLAGQDNRWRSSMVVGVSLMVNTQFALHKARQTNLLHLSCASFGKQNCQHLLLCPKQWNIDYEFMPSPTALAVPVWWTTRCNNREFHNMNLTAAKISNLI